MKGIVDRIEEGIVVVEAEDQSTVLIPAARAQNASAGDCVIYAQSDDGFSITEILRDETEARKKRISALMDDLFES